ncbi:MAG: phosphatase PAP2 family protein [Desulfosarcinaceae bacterium]|nr:phosphatase PAP2 family protein [Desulfosarcinaceae bacterium]
MCPDLRSAAGLTLLFTLLIARPAAADTLEVSGDLLQVLLPSAAYGVTWIKEDPTGRRQFVRSFATTLATTYALKLGIHKERPNGGDMAFPSGHTSAAFSGAAFITRRYGWRLGLPACLGAGIVGHSRIAAEKHDPEDVVAGALIGILPTLWFTPERFYEALPRLLLDRNRLGLVWALLW